LEVKNQPIFLAGALQVLTCTLHVTVMLAPLNIAAVVLMFYLRGVGFFIFLQATIGIDFLSKTMYLEDRTVSKIFVALLYVQ